MFQQEPELNNRLLILPLFWMWHWPLLELQVPNTTAPLLLGLFRLFLLHHRRHHQTVSMSTVTAAITPRHVVNKVILLLPWEGVTAMKMTRSLRSKETGDNQECIHSLPLIAFALLPYHNQTAAVDVFGLKTI
jgi:hypothetical protein